MLWELGAFKKAFEISNGMKYSPRHGSIIYIGFGVLEDGKFIRNEVQWNGNISILSEFQLNCRDLLAPFLLIWFHWEKDMDL